VPNPRLRNAANRVKSVDTDDAVPSPINIPNGCPFHPRCPLYAAKGKPAECRSALPELLPLKSQSDHVVRCHFAEE
jgi:oligopeptide/dipeptide ABC transporter ATP-binding protein